MVLRRKKGGGGREANNKEARVLNEGPVIIYGGGGRIQGRISLFSGGREGGSVVADRVKSGTVAN